MKKFTISASAFLILFSSTVFAREVDVTEYEYPIGEQPKEVTILIAEKNKKLQKESERKNNQEVSQNGEKRDLKIPHQFDRKDKVLRKKITTPQKTKKLVEKSESKEEVEKPGTPEEFLAQMSGMKIAGYIGGSPIYSKIEVEEKDWTREELFSSFDFQNIEEEIEEEVTEESISEFLIALNAEGNEKAKDNFQFLVFNIIETTYPNFFNDGYANEDVFSIIEPAFPTEDLIPVAIKNLKQSSNPSNIKKIQEDLKVEFEKLSQ